MKEPDVTLTDYLLALEAFAFAVLIARSATATPVARWFVIFFAATAAASLIGGTVHGFLTNSVVLWRLVLVSLGIVSAAAWAIGARLLFSDRVADVLTVAAWVEFLAYALLVISGADSFVVAVANYLPSTMFLLAGFFVSYQANPVAPLALGLSGLLLTIVAAGVQQTRIALHPTYFNHNALYHLLQAIALLLIFRAAMFLTGTAL
jgi:uncharacterized protein DUF6962